MTTLNRVTAVIAVVAVLFAGYITYVNIHTNTALQRARFNTQAEIAYSKESDAKAARAEIAAAEWQETADSAVAIAFKQAERARILAAKLKAARPADSSAVAAIDSTWSLAYQGALRATAALQSAVDTLRPALASERATNARLRAAAGELVKRSAPSFWARITPKVGVGGAIGIDPTTQKFSKAVGVTLSWAL